MCRFTTDIPGCALIIELSEQRTGRVDVATEGTVSLTPKEARIAAFELIKLAEFAEDLELERGKVGQIVRDHIASKYGPSSS